MNALINNRQINLLYDISVLGLDPCSRTGVFRVIENIAYGLINSQEINLFFCETQSVGVMNAVQNYLLSSPELKQVPFVNSNLKLPFLVDPEILEETNIFHSGFHYIPEQLRQEIHIKKFLTIHDLIPVLLPHLFRGINDSDYYRMWRSLNSLDIEDYVICVSHATRNDLLNNVKLDPAKVFVVHNAASSDIFYPCSDLAKIASVHHKYSIPEYPYILGLSTLEPRKNIDHVIRCFAKLVQEQSLKDLNLVLVGGKGWDYNKIFEEIENHALLKERIIFTGYIADEDLAALYSGALAFVYMSFYEGFGLPPLEAMQCGVPVVTSNTSSFPEVVGDAGILLDPKDVDGFCNSIFEIYKKPSLREAMSLASLEQAKKFSWEKCIQETIAAYKTALLDGNLSVSEARVYSTAKNLFIPDILKAEQTSLVRNNIKIIVDGVFFQLYNTGITRVWKSLLEEWVANGFAKNIVVLDRAGLNTVGTVPRMPGIQYRLVTTYDYSDTDADREMLQQVCDEEGADLFISSYYTTPLSTPSVFLAHDMIPELMGADPNHPMWREKHYGIQNASAYIAVSENTARDLVKFFPHICSESITVAHNGVEHQTFSPASSKDINRFKTKYGISKPYFILVGAGGGYKNTIIFFKAFAQLYTKQGFEIICTGSGSLLATEFRKYTSGNVVHMLQLSNEDLSIAYSGAVALVYPSVYEGFGLPVLEAIACGCPVITCPNASIPEVAGEAALYVNNDVDGLEDALCEVQKPNVRNSLIAAGLEQAKKFSWSKMAQTVSSALIDATLLRLNLKDINLIVFPDWSQPEESVCFDLEQVIKAITTHHNSSKITLLVDNGDLPEEQAALILSSVSISLLMQEELDVSEGLEISIVGQLSESQWEALLPRIQVRILLENENQQVITSEKFNYLPSCRLDSLNQEQLNFPQTTQNSPNKHLVENCSNFLEISKINENKYEVMEILSKNKSNTRDMIYLGDYKALTKTVFGDKIVVDTRDISLAPHILLDGYWEHWITKVFREAVKEGMTVVEIGANIGYYTLMSASMVGEKGKVYAFEANPRVFETLYKNIAINGLTERTSIVNKVVFNESKKLSFHILERYQGSSSVIKFSNEFLRKYMDEVKTIEVDSISLDEFFVDKNQKIDLIKIDAEGSEPCIFQGMRKIINNNPQITIICEFAPQLILGTGEDPRKFLEEVTNYGFDLKMIDMDSKLVNVSINELLTTTSCELFLTR